MFAIIGVTAPRFALVLVLIARPETFTAAFSGNWFLPLLGVLFIPFTTLMYVILWDPGGLSGGDWFWLIAAFMIDFAGMVSSAYGNRRTAGGYSYT